MKNNIMEYKGYHTKIEFDAEELVLRGKIEGINDLVNFECENIQNVEKEFHDAVDDYLVFCEEVGKEPDKEYKGLFNVRISPELHKKIAVLAMKNGDTLNASVEKAIQQYVLGKNKSDKYLQGPITIVVEGLKNESTYQSNENLSRWSSNIVPFKFSDRVNMRYDEEGMEQ